MSDQNHPSQEEQAQKATPDDAQQEQAQKATPDATQEEQPPAGQEEPPAQQEQASQEAPAPIVAAAPEKPTPRFRLTFPLIGIGMSAGGLEALENFVRHLPTDQGLAIVIVQHLQRERQSSLPDILRRATALPVTEITDGTEIQPDHLYTIPPDHDLVLQIERNRALLHITQPVTPPHTPLPIDTFFQSLAEKLGDQAIGVILSGTGGDGTRGLRTIKEKGGMVMVQTPDSAAFGGMPQSAIETDVVDYILPPQDMPQQLLAYIQREFAQRTYSPEPLISPSAVALQKVFMLLRRHTGHDFSLYKKSTILRRIERRLTVNQIRTIEEYAQYIERNGLEMEHLFRELLIGVTSFFRDPPAFHVIETKVLPRLVKNHARNVPIRCWVAGCSTGEEAYSLAILLREYLDAHKLDEYEVQIFATDIDPQAIEKARAGRYPETIAADVTTERLKRFFTREDSTYQVNKRIRDMVIFAVQSVIKDPPFSRIDLLSCRNLLIYMGPELQRRVVPLFHYALNTGGVLFLGSSESLGEMAPLFETIDRTWSLFERSSGTPAGQQRSVNFPIFTHGMPDQPSEEQTASSTINLRTIAEQSLIHRYAPSCVIINEQGDIFYAHGRTGKFLEPAIGEFSSNILRMAREGLRLAITTGLRRVAATRREVIYHSVQVQSNGEKTLINLVFEPLAEHNLILVAFEPVPPPPAIPPDVAKDQKEDPRDVRIRQLEQELQSVREYLQTTTEELETSNEEVKSSNEELQSANEELQSTNEELETSKEELQSVNEEQESVNAELRDKIEELNRVNNDLSNLLASIDIGTVFLDLELCINRFTPAVKNIMHLREADIGRPLNEVVTTIDIDLSHEAQYVLERLVPITQEVLTRHDEWYQMRIMPYRTTNNFIEGVIMTFANITQQKQAQVQIPRLHYIVEHSPLLVLILDAQGCVEYANPQVYELTALSEQAVIGHTIQELLAEQDPAATDTFATAWEQMQAGQEWQGEWVLLGKASERLPVLAHLLPMKDLQQDGMTALLFAWDQREQRKQAMMIQRLVQLLHIVSNWYQILASEADEQKLLNMLCHRLVDTIGYLSAWIGMVEDSSTLQIRPLAHAGYQEGFLETLDLVWAEAQQTHMPANTVMRTGRPAVMQYIQSDPMLVNWQELAQTRGYNAMITLALHYQGRVFGILHIQATEPDAFDPQTIEVLQILADNIAYGIYVLREE